MKSKKFLVCVLKFSVYHDITNVDLSRQGQSVVGQGCDQERVFSVSTTHSDPSNTFRVETNPSVVSL